MNRLLKSTILFSSLFSLLNCSNKAKSPAKSAYFGEYGYKGKYLKEYASKEISAQEAKQIVGSSSIYLNKSISIDDAYKVLDIYGSLEAKVKYYVEEEEQQQVRVDFYQGTDFKQLILSNYYQPFAQMSVNYLFVSPILIDEMEMLNKEYLESDVHYTSPFKTPFTYHTNEEGIFILQTHHFAELPSSICGGIGSTFREDSELVFDAEAKISHWQSSLGLYTSTPTGTIRTGYIFEVDFNWNER